MSDIEDEEGVDEPVLSDEEQEEEEEVEQVADAPLKKEMMPECLSLLCKTGSGLAHAYVRLDIHDRDITDISLLNCYIHLRYLDVSGNKLSDISSLNSLTHLLTLKADRNLLSSAKLDELPYLQTASFANNKVMDTEGINHPLLESLNLNYNEIVEVTGLDPVKLGRLTTLEIRNNKLMSTNGMNLPKVKNLYLADNAIRELEGLDRLEHLTQLHLRSNQIETLDGFSDAMKNLQYINLRGNRVSNIKEVEKLKCLPLLRALVLMENPVSDEDDYRMEVLIALRRLERLDKEEYTDEERQEAEEIYEQRRQEEALSSGAQEVITDED